MKWFATVASLTALCVCEGGAEATTQACQRWAGESYLVDPSAGGHTSAGAVNSYGGGSGGVFAFGGSDACHTNDVVDGTIVDIVAKCWATSTDGTRFVQKRFIEKRVSGHFVTVSDRVEVAFGPASMSGADMYIIEKSNTNYSAGYYDLRIMLQGPASLAADWACTMSGMVSIVAVP
jgi:hypothetical protein